MDRCHTGATVLALAEMCVAMQVAALFATVAGAYPKLILKHNIHIFQVTKDGAPTSLHIASFSFLSTTRATPRVQELIF